MKKEEPVREELMIHERDILSCLPCIFDAFLSCL
jgi:hypothetical protein